MNTPEYINWLNSLKAGDKVAIQSFIPGRGFDYSIDTVVKITPTGQIQTAKQTSKFRDDRTPTDRYRDGCTLQPLTDEIRVNVFRKVTCIKLRTMKFEELSTDKLRRMMEIVTEKGDE